MNLFFFSSRRRHTRWPRDWSSDVCSSDLVRIVGVLEHIDVLVAQLPHHGVDADALHADACADRVDALIVADDSKIGRASCRERLDEPGRGGGGREDEKAGESNSTHGGARG